MTIYEIDVEGDNRNTVKYYTGSQVKGTFSDGCEEVFQPRDSVAFTKCCSSAEPPAE